jgi:hypothetical protein
VYAKGKKEKEVKAMKRTIYIALILCLAVTLMAGCGKKKNGSGPTGPAIPEVGTILWNFETEEEVAKFDNDNTGAEIEYNTEIVAQGTAAVKVTPSGEAGETKIAAVLDQDKISAWNASENLVLKLYMEKDMDPAINGAFVGIAEVTGGSWSWVDGTTFNIAGAQKGKWNTCIFDLTKQPALRGLDPTRAYKIYFSFFNDDGGEKTPLSSDSSFYVDYIYLDGKSSGEDPVVEPIPAVIWSFESESEELGFEEDGGTGAVPEYTEDQALTGSGALKITPNGEAEETKVKAVLPADYYENWQTCSKLVINLYMEEEMDPVINKIFIGMADVTGGEWSWVEGTLYSLTEATAGAWNTCEIPLPHTMVKIDPIKQYELIFGFFNEESGTKTPLKDAFFIDDISVE